MIDDLISRLQRTVPTTGHIARMGSTEYRVNPDGPEAAEALILLRDALTPSAETKAAYIGEFSFTVEDTDDEWGLPITRRFDVPWTTIKEIMGAIRERALSPIKIEKAGQ